MNEQTFYEGHPCFSVPSELYAVEKSDRTPEVNRKLSNSLKFYPDFGQLTEETAMIIEENQDNPNFKSVICFIGDPSAGKTTFSNIISNFLTETFPDINLVRGSWEVQGEKEAGIEEIGGIISPDDFSNSNQALNYWINNILNSSGRATVVLETPAVTFSEHLHTVRNPGGEAMRSILRKSFEDEDLYVSIYCLYPGSNILKRIIGARPMIRKTKSYEKALTILEEYRLPKISEEDWKYIKENVGANIEVVYLYLLQHLGEIYSKFEESNIKKATTIQDLSLMRKFMFALSKEITIGELSDIAYPMEHEDIGLEDLTDEEVNEIIEWMSLLTSISIQEFLAELKTVNSEEDAKNLIRMCIGFNYQHLR